MVPGMTKWVIGLLGVWLGMASSWSEDALIVADEFPAMHYLAERLHAEADLPTRVVAQERLPAKLSPFRAVVVYLHGVLRPGTERTLIAYTRAGGRLVVLHHSISSGKRRNREWFSFLGVKLPEGPVAQGGYQWIEPARIAVVNLAPHHYITTHDVRFPDRVLYTPSDVPGGAGRRPALVLEHSEAYLNHVLTSPRTILLGLKYTDPRTGRVWMQDRAGWLRPAGRGLVVYFLPGHSLRDFQQPAYRQMIINAIRYQPEPKKPQPRPRALRSGGRQQSGGTLRATPPPTG
jgi:hypothetical protein